MNTRKLLRTWAPLVVSMVALFVALTGSAGALKGKNTVDSGDLKPGAVKNGDVADSAIDRFKIGRHEVVTGNLADGAVSSDKLGSQSVGAQALQGGAVGGGKLGSITVRSNSNFFDGSNTRTISVSCQPGSRMLTGGALTTGDAVLKSSYPDAQDTDNGIAPDPTTWTAQGYLRSDSPLAGIRVYVLCLPQA